MITRVAEFLSFGVCRSICERFDALSSSARQLDYTGHPVLDWSIIQADSELQRLCSRIVDRTVSLVKTIHSDELCAETVILTAIGRGGFHPLHADNCKLEGGRWTPNHTPKRVFSIILYLNEDFDGGEIVFPSQQCRVKPTTGLLLGFPSGNDYVHEVSEVTYGLRYTMPIWFVRSHD